MSKASPENKTEAVEWTQYFAKFRSASDFVVVIIGGTFLDVHLEMLLDQFLAADKKLGGTLLNQTKKRYGDDFSGRIKKARDWGLLADAEHHDLDIVRAIRNTFVHGLHGPSLNRNDIATRCRMLSAPDILHKEGIDPVTNPADRFKLTVELLADQIAQRGDDAIMLRRPNLIDYAIARLFASQLQKPQVTFTASGEVF